VDIGQYDVEFVPRWEIKSQALANFIAEWTDSGLWGIDKLTDHWVMYFDGSYTLKGAWVGVVLIPPEGDTLKYVIQLELLATNNITEYEGLVNGLRLAKISIYDDSSSGEIHSWWPSKYRKNMTTTVT
jgi:hypothetical protein